MNNMTHTYQITGMTCGNCEAQVKSSLLVLPQITGVEVSKDDASATITMDKHIALADLQRALGSKYAITAKAHNEQAEQAKSWLSTYKPILLIFAYIAGLSIIAASGKGVFDWMQFMNLFMAGFFLTFSFFKMLDLEGFAESYSMYDIVAKKWKAWGFIYPFVELVLGISYAAGFQAMFTNVITLAVMTVSIIGVLQSVLNKRRIQCACLGAVFNLPMSTITIIEDALMIGMSAGMVFALT
jgi:copper chaperone CopZ